MTWHKTERHDGGVDGAFQNLGSQLRSIKVKVSVFADTGLAYSSDSGFNALLCSSQGIGNIPHLVLRLDFPVGPERIGLSDNTHAFLTKLISKPEGKRRRDGNAGDLQIAENLE